MTVPWRVDGPDGAPVLLLANSLGTTSELWEPQMAAFTGWFRVVRYELRGHAGSPAPPGPYSMEDLGRDLLDVLDEVGAERAAICGLSVGGMVAMWVAAAVPARVDRLVLCCTAPYLPPPDQWEERAAAVRARGAGHVLPALLPRWFTPGFTEARPDIASAVASMLDSATAEGYAGCCDAIASMDQRHALSAITAPTLVVAGAEDPVVPPAMALELANAIQGSSLVVLAHAAHLANVEQPERFTGAVLDHLLGPAARRGDVVRRAVLGDEHVDRARATGSFNDSFQDLIVRYAWGEIWNRPGLDRPTRSCLTIGMLVALGRLDELALHVRGARRNGVTADEIGEVLLQAAIYCGVPAANAAFAVAERALAAEDDAVR